MRKLIFILAAGLISMYSSKLAVFAEEISWEDIARGNMGISCVLAGHDNYSEMYFGSGRGIFKSEDAGSNWRNILSVSGVKGGVNFLSFDPGNKNFIYAACGNGLYFSANQGRSWKRIFRGKNYFENECTALAVLPSVIYLGTKAGLFSSPDKGRTWHKEPGAFGSSAILAIACNPKEPGYIYLAASSGLFLSRDDGRDWEKVFVTYASEGNEDIEEDTQEEDEGLRGSGIRYIAVDPGNSGFLYLAASSGIYKSRDKGKTWDTLPGYGLLDKELKFLLVSPESTLYAITKSGIFRFKEPRWIELSLGLAATEINSLYLDKEGRLYAACKEGLFRAQLTAHDNQDSLESPYSKNEPPIKAVQDAAIKYAEVEPEKIKEWRKKAKMKAVLPRLTVGIDNNRNSNYEIYTSATTHYIYEGPDDRSSGWDVTLSWELGDLIWNSEQTSIDARSRLMVELREDVLDQVTRLYFERLRVMMEADSLSIEDRKKRFEKELRIEELTASLDALTGGYFSEAISKIKRQN